MVHNSDLDISDDEVNIDDLKSKKKKKGGCNLQKFFEFFIINHRCGLYVFWHEFIDALCIVSSFFYMHFAAQRHDEMDIEDKWLRTTILVIEVCFLADFLMSFIKDYENPLDPMGPAIRNITKIFFNYTRNAFIYDAIALAPVTAVVLYRDRNELLYIIKIIRLKRGIENL